MSVQLNVRTTPVLVEEIDRVVHKGYFRNRTEAVNEALRLLIRRYQLEVVEKRMQTLAEGNVGLPSATDAVVDARSEEDR